MKRSRFNPSLLGALLLVVAVFGWFGYQWLAARRAVAAERDAVLVAVDAGLDRRPLDGGELSRLMARIHELPDATTAPDLLRAQARIEFARERPERARDLFAGVAAQPGATAVDHGLAAAILLAVHAHGAPDRAAASALLEEALAFALNAYAETHDPADLLHAWLAAIRLSDRTRTQELAARIAAECPDSPAAALVQLARAFTPSTPLAEVDAVAARFEAPPAELAAMAALVRLQRQEVDGAVALVAALLGRAGGIVEVRLAAAVTFHACALGSAAGGADRASWLARRDPQLEWLLLHAAPDDTRRANWAQMLQQR